MLGSWFASRVGRQACARRGRLRRGMASSHVGQRRPRHGARWMSWHGMIRAPSMDRTTVTIGNLCRAIQFSFAYLHVRFISEFCCDNSVLSFVGFIIFIWLLLPNLTNTCYGCWKHGSENIDLCININVDLKATFVCIAKHLIKKLHFSYKTTYS